MWHIWRRRGHRWGVHTRRAATCNHLRSRSSKHGFWSNGQQSSESYFGNGLRNKQKGFWRSSKTLLLKRWRNSDEPQARCIRGAAGSRRESCGEACITACTYHTIHKKTMTRHPEILPGCGQHCSGRNSHKMLWGFLQQRSRQPDEEIASKLTPQTRIDSLKMIWDKSGKIMILH